MRLKDINLPFIFIILLYIPLFTYFYEINLTGGHTYLTADWLINYNFGYIKRGLSGSIILYFFKSSENILTFITFSLISIYIINIYLTLNLFKKYEQSLQSYLLLVSPATLLFPLFDSQGGFRKEMLGFTVLLILLNFDKSKNNFTFLLFSSLIFGFAVFSHEVNLFFAIPIFFILKKYYQNYKNIKYVLFMFPILLNIFFYFLYSNDELTMRLIKDNICNELVLKNLGSLCNTGIFDYIYWDINANLNQTLFHVLDKKYEYQNYIYLFLISFLPIMLTTFFKKNIIFISIFGLSFIPLFFLAIDWGRWVHIIIFSLSLIMFRDDNQKSFRLLLTPLLIPYSFMFKIEHCCKPEFNVNFENTVINFNFFIKTLYNFYM